MRSEYEAPTPENNLAYEYCQNCSAICETDGPYPLPENPKPGEECGELTWIAGWNFWGCRACVLQCAAALALDIETGCEMGEIGLVPEVELEPKVNYLWPIPVLQPVLVKVASLNHIPEFAQALEAEVA